MTVSKRIVFLNCESPAINKVSYHGMYVLAYLMIIVSLFCTMFDSQSPRLSEHSNTNSLLVSFNAICLSSSNISAPLKVKSKSREII